MSELPARGPAVRRLGLALPPAQMPSWRGLRPLKRWRYVGVYTRELMLCVGEARAGPISQRWWAIALPDGTLHERTTAGRGGMRLVGSRVTVAARGVRIGLELDEGRGEHVETASPAGEAYIWTRKQAAVPVHGSVRVAGVEHRLEGPCAVIDDSAGYHPRHSAWKWSAGVGRSDDGRPVGWNLVTGLHDSFTDSERSVWVDGVAREVPPVRFADDLSTVAGLTFDAWSAREHHANLVLFRSDYRQPFGSFEGELPGGVRLAEGFGVMEEHDVRW